jgi:hypothetical protein
MQAKYTVALALAAGFAVGAGAIHGLHAAAAPPAYVIGEIAVKDEAGYKNDFLPAAQKAIDDNGGKYLAGGFNKTFSITGEPPALSLSGSLRRILVKPRIVARYHCATAVTEGDGPVRVLAHWCLV